MKFVVSDLITRIDEKIADLEAETVPVHEAAVAKWDQDRVDWLTEFGAGYIEFANRIKDKIRKGRPILVTDIPVIIKGTYSNGYVKTHSSSPRPQRQAAATGELVQLRGILGGIADETVTDAALRAVGFKSLGWLFS